MIDLVARRFRVLGEPMRIKLLDDLREGDATVTELQKATGASQQNVSKHLAILHAVGIVSRTKRGTSTRYAIQDPEIFQLGEWFAPPCRRPQRDPRARAPGRSEPVSLPPAPGTLSCR